MCNGLRLHPFGAPACKYRRVLLSSALFKAFSGATGFYRQTCCCATNHNIDAMCCVAQKNTCDIATAIHAEGEATRALMNAQELQRVRDELGQARAAISNYNQSQYILGQIGRYYTNPPCAGPQRQSECGACSY